MKKIPPAAGCDDPAGDATGVPGEAPRTSAGPRTIIDEAISNTTTAKINARRDIFPPSVSAYKSATLVT
jgi:hypothetical protein